jgi:aspartyl-tRNA(Asn)/glutamyl-tRNA(Gln) amidotransferase subunit C
MSEIIGLQEVRHVAALARLRLTDAEATACRRDLGNILAYIDTLNKLDTSKVEPMSHVRYTGTPMRADEPAGEGEYTAALLANAPARERNWYQVPQVIE